MAASKLAAQTIPIQLGMGVAASLICALLLEMFWAHQGLADRPLLGALAQAARPQGLEFFVTLALPAAVFLPSLILAIIIWLLPPERRGQVEPEIREALRQDAVSYLILPAMLLLPMVWRELGNGFLAAGLLFLGALTFKTSIVLRLLWKAHLRRRPGQDDAMSFRGQAAVFVALWMVLGLAAVWVNQAVSTTGEEAGLLLEAEAYRRGPGFVASQEDQRLAAKEFHWPLEEGQAPPRMKSGGVFALFIAPLQAAGGRLGVLLFFAGLLAFTGLQVLLWLEEAGLPRGPSAAAAGLVLFSAPVLVIGQQALPDAPAMLLWAIGLRLLVRLDRHPWAAGLGAACTAAVMVWLKLRLAGLAGGLAVAGGAYLLGRRWGWLKAFLLGLALLGLAAACLWQAPQAWWPKALAFSWGEALALMREAPSLVRAAAHALAGLALDQNYGVLTAAPIYLLALAGIPAAIRLHRRPALLALLPAALYLASICLLRWHLWHGGQAGPGRLIAVALPALALPLAVALEGLNRPWRRLWALAPALLGLFYAWLLTLAPAWRFSLPTGVNPLLASLEEAMGLFLRQLAPSLFVPSAAFAPWLVGALALGLIWGIAVWRQAKGKNQAPAGLGEREALAVALICGLVFLGGLCLGSSAQVTSLEAEGLRAKDASLWSQGLGPGEKRGQLLRDGGQLSGRLYFPGGESVLRVQGLPQAGGRITASLEGRLFEQPWSTGLAEAVVSLGPVSRGAHWFSLTWASCPEDNCGLMVDRVQVAAAPPAPSPANDQAPPDSSR